MSNNYNTQPQTTHAQGILYGWKEISNYIGCCQETAQKYAKTHKLPVKKVGGRVLIAKAIIDKWARGK